MKKSRKIGIGIVAVIVAGSLLGGDPSPAGEELVTKPSIEVRTETGARVTTPKVAESKVTTPKPKATKPKTEVTKPKATKPKATKPKVTKPKATKPKATKPKVTKSSPKKVSYIINTKSGVFHRKGCHHAKKIKNPRTSTELRKELSKKYKPCKVCNP